MKHHDVRREPWTPEGQAGWDQLHAAAIDKLRAAQTFLLAYVAENEAGQLEMSAVGANCNTGLHGRALFYVLERAVEEMRATFVGDDDDAA